MLLSLRASKKCIFIVGMLLPWHVFTGVVSKQ